MELYQFLVDNLFSLFVNVFMICAEAIVIFQLHVAKKNSANITLFLTFFQYHQSQLRSSRS